MISRRTTRVSLGENTEQPADLGRLNLTIKVMKFNEYKPITNVDTNETADIDEHPVTTYRRLIAEQVPRMEKALIALHGEPDEVAS